MYRGEWFNSLSHLLGAVAALAGMVVLVVFATLQGDVWKIVSFSVYGLSLFLLYLFSTLYHSFNGEKKKLFRKFDYIAIYLLIAGSYTPFALVTLNGTWGWSLFGVVWGLAIIGIVLDALPTEGRRIIPMIIYVLMGWLVIVAINPLLDSLTTTGVIWLLAGGLCYSFGLIFFALDSRYPVFHAIWHLFVLAGSTTHYITIFLYVL
ncbi:MAG: hemolysin III family protein [Gammaproteobacteria bacterium]